MTTIASSVWIATALLHRENPEAVDFPVGEIVEKAIKEKIVDGFRPGLQVHASKHCVANKSPNPSFHRMLFETVRGRRRLFKTGDPFAQGRERGKIRPEKRDVPPVYQPLLEWYEAEYSKRASHSQPKSRSSSGSSSIPPAASQPATGFISADGSLVIPDHLRKSFGLTEGTRMSIRRENDRIILQPVDEERISRLRGCCKGGESLIELREREHRDEQY
jgi:AbrB family looped-hinge helix DNA binding protein